MANAATPSTAWLNDVELLDTHLEKPDLSMAALAKGSADAGTVSGSAVQGAIQQDLLVTLRDGLDAAVPWFLNQMPPLYQWITPREERLEHLTEIVSGKVLSHGQEVERWNNQTQCSTIIAAGDNGNAARNLAPRLGRVQAKFVSLFLSLDKRVAVCSMLQSPYRTGALWTGADKQQKKASILQSLSLKPTAEVENYLNAIDADLMDRTTSKMLAIGFSAVKYCQENENAYVHLTTLNEPNDSSFRVDIGLKGFPVTAGLENVVGILNRYNFTVRRSLGFEVRVSDNQQFAILQIVAAANSGEKLNPESTPWGRVMKALKALNYVDHGDEFSALMQGNNPRSLNESNLIRAIANWAHIFLTKVNPYYYGLDRVSKVIVRNDAFMEQCIRFFRARFDPRFDGDRKARAAETSRTVEGMLADIQDDVERNILREGYNFLQHILKTNYFLVSKGGLSFRVDPQCLNKEFYPDSPYGIFYLIGRDYRGFQVRYRDIARGGVRVVMPRNSADYDNALAGVFDEVNGLASAQQMKNKDIPEGGSKAVLVVRPGGNRHLAVKAAISGLLDLITLDQKTGKLADGIIDYFGQEEIIYLGPDENMTDDLIVWVIEHALYRGYRYAYAFMSSKPDFGINHKTYGVTSEGLNVYLDNVLRHLKLSGPNASFRVKMTGGPDGDVAGNELKILHREYGERARVVSIADGYGAAFDPNGLNWDELLRLVRESKSIVEFSKNKLSGDSKAFVISADSKENIKIRDNLFATVEAEIFIPAGGRPYTVKDNNWQRFLKTDGSPSALAIVEGANIFFTPNARKKLVQSGVVVIKDSSANKTGVICSSYEIIACLTLSPEEFAALKTTYVNQVVQILREKADNEAKLLFREWQLRSNETNLVDLSYEISAEINKAKDITRERLNRLSDAELSSEKFNFILYQHCPQILVEKYRDRIVSRLPRAHKIAIMSAYMASHLVYKEGLSLLDTLEPEQVFKMALEYIDAEQTVDRMILDVTNSALPEKDKLVTILRMAGAKQLASSRIT
jgi:glutamate dehydrogenase